MFLDENERQKTNKNKLNLSFVSQTKGEFVGWIFVVVSKAEITTTTKRQNAAKKMLKSRRFLNIRSEFMSFIRWKDDDDDKMKQNATKLIRSAAFFAAKSKTKLETFAFVANKVCFARKHKNLLDLNLLAKLVRYLR